MLHPITEFRRLYEFLGIPFTIGHEMIIKFHMGKDPRLNKLIKQLLESNILNRGEYNYMTFRTDDFDMFRWKTELNLQVRVAIQYMHKYSE